MEKYDVIVLGGGSGGLYTAMGLVSFGFKIALVEKEDTLGGECLHFGCVPSKAHITATKLVANAYKAKELYGMNVSGEIDIKDVNKFVQESIDVIQESDSIERFEKAGIDVYIGAGSFIDEHTIKTGDKELYGHNIVISTGSSAFIPPIKGIDTVKYYTNENIFNIEETPKKMLTIGAGPIGLELSNSMANIGVDVTIIESNDKFLGRADESISQVMYSEMCKIATVKMSSKVIEVSQKDNIITATIENSNGTTETIECDTLLVATGRAPNVKGLSLENAGVNYDRKIPVSETMQTNKKHIFAVGDVNGQFQFTHAASHEARAVVAKIAFGVNQKVDYTNFSWVIYTTNEAFQLGLTEAEAKAKYGDSINVYKFATDDVDRFIAEHATVGFCKVITDSKGLIIGCSAIGKDAGEWMQQLTLAKANKIKFKSLASIIYPYPTKTEILKRTANLYWYTYLTDNAIGRLGKKIASFRIKEGKK